MRTTQPNPPVANILIQDIFDYTLISTCHYRVKAVFTRMALRHSKSNKIPPQENIPVLALLGKSNIIVTHIARQKCVKGNDARGLSFDDSKGLNNDAYHPGSNSLPNQVAF
jgi:hypothetical protein